MFTVYIMLNMLIIFITYIIIIALIILSRGITIILQYVRYVYNVTYIIPILCYNVTYIMSVSYTHLDVYKRQLLYLKYL